MANDLQNERPTIKVFCGVQAFSRRMALLSRTTTDNLARAELATMVDELAVLDAVLKRLQHERGFVDESDIDQAIDRLRRGPGWGA